MSRRKLKFDLRKNYARKKVAARIIKPSPPDELCVSIPIFKDDLQVDVRSFPAPDIVTLYQRLVGTGILPEPWIASIVDSSRVAIYKLNVQSPLKSAAVSHMLTISDDFSWTINVANNEVNISQSQLLHRISSSNLQTAQATLVVLRLLDDSKVCVGNPDDRFSCLVSRNKGKFTNHLGNFIS